MAYGDNGTVSHREVDDIARVAHDAQARVGVVEYAVQEMTKRMDRMYAQMERQQINVSVWSLGIAGALTALGYFLFSLFSVGRVP